MKAEELRDVQIMGRVAAGDGRSFRELFDRHGSLVLGFLTRMLGNREEAEEILQEAFLAAWEQAGRYRPERATPRGWLLMLARSRALDRIRSEGARRRREERVVAEPATPESESPRGTRDLEASERRSRLLNALEALPTEQRQCLEMAFFDGLTHREIASRLETPLGTVKSRILLGMNKLRQGLAPY